VLLHLVHLAACACQLVPRVVLAAAASASVLVLELAAVLAAALVYQLAELLAFPAGTVCPCLLVVLGCSSLAAVCLLLPVLLAQFACAAVLVAGMSHCPVVLDVVLVAA
jgi:hypothetical protein